MSRMQVLASRAIFNRFDVADGLDGTSANTYADAAVEAVKRRVARIILSYEPLHGSSVFDLTEAVLKDTAYDEVEDGKA